MTVFEQTANRLGRQLEECAVDHEAFERPMVSCDLNRCRATCCHDGAVLSEEEAGVLESMEEGTTYQEKGKWRTVLRAAKEGELAEDFPKEFARTRCVFLDERHYCRLQVKAVEEGRHPWFYKPMACWMHPILVAGDWGERPRLTIATDEDDSRQVGGVSFGVRTGCGECVAGGRPAREVLKMELEALSELGGRDFVKELG